MELDNTFLKAVFNKLKELKKTKKYKGQITMKQLEMKNRNKSRRCIYCGDTLENVCGHIFCKNGHVTEDGEILQPVSFGLFLSGTMITVNKLAPKFAYNQK